MERLISFNEVTSDSDQTIRQKMVTYLLDCYDRVVYEERHIKVIKFNSTMLLLND